MTGSTSVTSSTVVGAVELREVATRLGNERGRVFRAEDEDVGE